MIHHWQSRNKDENAPEKTKENNSEKIINNNNEECQGKEGVEKIGGREEVSMKSVFRPLDDGDMLGKDGE